MLAEKLRCRLGIGGEKEANEGGIHCWRAGYHVAFMDSGPRVEAETGEGTVQCHETRLEVHEVQGSVAMCPQRKRESPREEG